MNNYFKNKNQKEDPENKNARNNSPSIEKHFIIKKISHYKRYVKNPNINHFNAQSHFIYDNDMGEIYLSKITNKNLIKLSNDEIKEIQLSIDKIGFEKIQAKSQDIIYIDEGLSKDLNSYFNIKTTNDPLKNFLLEEIKKGSNRNDFTVRKLSKKYKDINGNYISKSTIHNCLKKKLGFRYLKTTVKTNKLLEEDSIINSYAFVKVIARCLKLKLKILYCDESYIQNNNNNYYFWRLPNDEIYREIEPKKRLNLIMAIDEEKIIYYEINENSTNEEVFLHFMEKFYEEIIKKNLVPFVLILDNLSCHKTDKLLEFYSKKKINVLFNTPYLSSFNSIELSFRNLKRNLYSKIYGSIEEVKMETIKILNEESFKNVIKDNFRETLIKYLNFNNNNKNRNFNK